MGKVMEKVRLMSLYDSTKIREVEAVIDAGTTMLILPQNVGDKLGLRKVEKRKIKYANHQIQLKRVYRGVILELKGRDGIFDVLSEIEGSEPLVGQIGLESLDLIVGSVTKTVIPNPKSPDMPMVEIFKSNGI
jgi:predicted aspartyl protease